MPTLDDLTDRAGPWRSTWTQPPTTSIASDRFDGILWRAVHDQAAPLRALIAQLAELHPAAGHLPRDVFHALDKVDPEVRDVGAIQPSCMVNRQIVESLLALPQIDALRRYTVGDTYAAAAAVIALGEVLRRLLEETQTAQQAADEAASACRQAAAAAGHLDDALRNAGPDGDGDAEVPVDAAQAVDDAIARAQAAADVAQQATDRAADEAKRLAATLRQAIRAAAKPVVERAADDAGHLASWGVEPGELERMSYEQRARLAARMRGSHLARYADLIGRFRAMADAQRADRTQQALGELVGVTLGDDVTRLIPSELAALAMPALRAQFAVRLAESRLLVYDTHGELETGRGAIIACVDSSRSMFHGHPSGVTREAWSKAFALALLSHARAERRDFAGIVFSNPGCTRTFQFPASEPLSVHRALEFGEICLRGGTSFTTPLDVASDLLEAEYNSAGRQRADILLITDGQCDVPGDWLDEWTHRKDRLGFRVFGTAIETEISPVLRQLCDDVRTIDDLTDTTAVADIFRTI